jgi:hypothetical protein
MQGCYSCSHTCRRNWRPITQRKQRVARPLRIPSFTKTLYVGRAGDRLATVLLAALMKLMILGRSSSGPQVGRSSGLCTQTKNEQCVRLALSDMHRLCDAWRRPRKKSPDVVDSLHTHRHVDVHGPKR